MAFQVSPGINVTEVDLTTIVPAVATTVGGIVGFYEWGPADRVVLVDSPKSYRETFGNPTSSNYKQWFTGANFLNYGRTLLVARRTHDDAKNAVGAPVSYTSTGEIDGSLTGTIAVTFASEFIAGLTTTSGQFNNKVFFAPATASASTEVTEVTGPAYFSLSVAGIDGSVVNFNLDALDTGNVPSSLTGTVYENQTITYGSYSSVDSDKVLKFFDNYSSWVAATASSLATVIFGYTGSTSTPETPFDYDDTVSGTVSGTAGGSSLVNESVSLTWSAPENAWSGTAGEWIETRYIANSSGLTSSDYYGVFAKYPGEKGNSLKVSLFLGGNTAAYEDWTWYATQNIIGEAPSASGSDNLSRLVGDANDLFHFVVVDEDGLFTGVKNTVLERFPSVSLFPQSRSDIGSTLYYKSVINTNSRYVFIGGDELPSNPITDFENNFGLTGNTITTTDTYKVSYGAELNFGLSADYALDLSLAGGTGSYGENTSLAGQVGSDTIKGYNLFEDTENVNVSLIMAGDIHDQSTLGYLKAIVEERKDCVLFVSSENTDDSTDENTKKNKCLEAKDRVGSSSYVFIDSGYKYQYDQYNDRYRWLPMNGDTAGLVARTDLTNDPWFSPAGLNRGQIRNAIKLAFNPSKTFRDTIYPKGINPVISVPGEGTVLFGDRTALSKPSAFDRINVRRLFIVLEKAIAAASKYSLFEFNDTFTRQQFRSLVEPFLRDVKARRGIFDFKVVCDETNNTPEMIDRNEFAADIYIKPTRTINFIQLNFIATRTGVSFDEVGA